MKRWIFIIGLLLPVWVAQAGLPITSVLAGGRLVSGAATYTLRYDSINGSTANNQFSIGDSAPHFYVGQTLFVDTASLSLGKIVLAMATDTGNTASKTITVTLWTLVPVSGDLNTALASASTTGFQNGSKTNVTFTFTPFSYSSGTSYAITVDQGVVDASNFIDIYYDSLANAAIPWPSGTALGRWDQSKAANPTGGFPSFVETMQFYTTP